MDTIAGGPEQRRRLPLPVLAVGSALAVLAAGQAVALQRPAPEPEGVVLRVPLELYGFSSREDGTQTVTFQLRNEGRDVVVELISEALPGAQLVDRVVAGEPVGFREVGLGPDEDVEPFPLAAGTTAVVSLTYRPDGCFGTPTADEPVDVTVSAGGRTGVVPVTLPTLPDDAVGATPTDVVPWQVVLVRRLCG